MKIFKRLILFCLLIFISSQLSAQLNDRLWTKGYYINFSGQKIEGYFSVSGEKYNYIRFKKSEESKIFEDLSTSEAKIISNDKDFYFQSQEVVIRGEKETIFIKKIIKGKVDLYRGYDKIGWRYYLMNNIENDSILLIPPNAIKPFFKIVFKNCPNAWQDNYVYDLNSLLFTFEEANRCLGENAKILNSTGSIFVKETPPEVFSVGISPHVSYNFNASSFSANTIFSSSDEESTPGFGLNFLFKYNRFIQFETGIRFGSMKVAGKSSKGFEFNRPIYVLSMAGTEVLVQEQIYSFPSSAELKMSFYEIPIQGKIYILRNKKVSPFLGIGLTLRKMYSTSYERKFDQGYSGENVFISNPYPILENLTVDFLGYNITPLSSKVNWNFGFEYKINKRNSVHIAFHMSEQDNNFEARYRIVEPMELEINLIEKFNLKTTRRFIEVGYSYYFFEKTML